MPAYLYRWVTDPASSNKGKSNKEQCVEYLDELGKAGWRVVPGTVTFGEYGSPYHLLMEKIAEDE